jgi:hypothetical protein
MDRRHKGIQPADELDWETYRDLVCHAISIPIRMTSSSGGQRKPGAVSVRRVA